MKIQIHIETPFHLKPARFLNQFFALASPSKETKNHRDHPVLRGQAYLHPLIENVPNESFCDISENRMATVELEYVFLVEALCKYNLTASLGYANTVKVLSGMSIYFQH